MCQPLFRKYGLTINWGAQHCDLREGPCDHDPDSNRYPVTQDPSCGKCQTDKQMSDCLKQHPTGAGGGVPGWNCQSDTLDALKACCAKAPGWSPNWYSHTPNPGPDPGPYKYY